MKKYIIENKPTTSTDGYIDVVVEGETHINRVRIRSAIQFYTTESGYDYCHPLSRAKENAQAIADGLNQLERDRVSSKGSIEEQMSEGLNTINIAKEFGIQEKVMLYAMKILKLNPELTISEALSCGLGEYMK